ncbi:MAG TPA: tetratricopeptide repeat protein [Sphingobium sp.]
MKIGTVIIAAATWALIPGAAFAAPAEVGYAHGTLGVQDIMAGHLDRAERVLAAQNAEDARDPARLINIGIVYARSGRVQDARTSFLAAGSVPDEAIVLSDGREVSSRAVARQQLAALGQASVSMR